MSAELATVPHFPALRAGKEYDSFDRVTLTSHRDGTPVASVSQVNAGIVRRDQRTARERADALAAMPIAERLERCREASRIFLEEELPIGGDARQSPDDYVAALSATSGLPHALCRANMEKCAFVLRETAMILRGLTRGLDLGVLDRGAALRGGIRGGVPVWYVRATDALAAVLPSNSPGVHSLWIPAVALGVPLALKPGREEPWTPMRIVRALIAAGLPAEAFSLYPTDHEGAAALLETAGRAMLFGDEKVAAKYAGDPRIEVHGPGRSKVVLGADAASEFESYLDVLVASVAANGGRSCINASAIFTPSRADELAEALAERLAGVVPRDFDDPAATLAAFANPAFAEAMDAAIERGLAGGGARDVSLARRGTERRVEHRGATYLSPTVVRCDSLAHPLANTEFMFPFTSVVEVPEAAVPSSLGPSLVVTVISRSEPLVSALTSSRDVSRLNVGPIPTSRVEWDQPHEGNLFEFLYERRALQRAPEW